MTSNRKQSSTTDSHRNSNAVLSVAPKIFGVMILIGGFLLLSQLHILNFRSDVPGPKISGVTANSFQPKPTRVKIGSLNIDAAVEDLGLNRDGTLEVPKKAEQVGWFVDSPSPGAIGPAILVGHLDSVMGKAVFWDLNKIKPGDLIAVEREDGSKVEFKVDNSEYFKQNNFPADKVYGPIGFAGLRLITCAGTYSRIKGHYSDNLVVFASLVK